MTFSKSMDWAEEDLDADVILEKLQRPAQPIADERVLATRRTGQHAKRLHSVGRNQRVVDARLECRLRFAQTSAPYPPVAAGIST
jgi:hypothetical protein